MIVAGVLELVCGLMVLIGFFADIAAFVASGEMAIAYFMGHVMTSHTIWPVTNMGDPAVLFCFVFLLIEGGKAVKRQGVLADMRIDLQRDFRMAFDPVVGLEGDVDLVSNAAGEDDGARRIERFETAFDVSDHASSRFAVRSAQLKQHTNCALRAANGLLIVSSISSRRACLQA